MILLWTAVLTCLFGILHPTQSFASLCPTPPPGFIAKCIDVPASSTGSEVLRLYIEIYHRFDKSLPTILFLNGGPGGATDQFTGIPRLFSELSKAYNLVFFDPRGVGKSKLASGGELNFKHEYTTEENINDVDRVRKAILDKGSVILFGHSYGAHLALAYGAKFPVNVQKIIALNGALDEMGFLLQTFEKQRALEKALAAFPESDINALFTVLQSGQGKGRSGDPISLSEFIVDVFGLLGTYEGQTKELPNLFKNYIQRLVVGKEKLKIEVSAPKFVIPGIDPAINTYILCHDLLPQEKINLIDDMKIKSSAQQGKDALCAQAPVRHEDRGFNFKSRARNILASILIVGGSHDPLVPIAAQQRDFSLLKRAGKSVWYLPMDHVAHNPLTEAPECIWQQIHQFLSRDRIKTAQLNCASGN